MLRYFTVQEANETLQLIRPLVQEILEIRQIVLQRRPDLLPVLKKVGSNGGSQVASEMVEEFRRLEILVHLIQDTGVMVKDINTGLLDFPSRLEGRDIYLCWRYGEGEVGFWHEIDGGFTGRQPL